MANFEDGMFERELEYFNTEIKPRLLKAVDQGGGKLYVRIYGPTIVGSNVNGHKASVAKKRKFEIITSATLENPPLNYPLNFFESIAKRISANVKNAKAIQENKPELMVEVETFSDVNGKRYPVLDVYSKKDAEKVIESEMEAGQMMPMPVQSGPSFGANPLASSTPGAVFSTVK